MGSLFRYRVIALSPHVAIGVWQRGGERGESGGGCIPVDERLPRPAGHPADCRHRLPQGRQDQPGRRLQAAGLLHVRYGLSPPSQAASNVLLSMTVKTQCNII